MLIQNKTSTAIIITAGSGWEIEPSHTIAIGAGKEKKIDFPEHQDVKIVINGE